MRWLYHPYDSGAYVIATSSEQRDALRSREVALRPSIRALTGRIRSNEERYK
jgi:hypothetical protein